MTYNEWCRNHGVEHAHCGALPECEHPQPIVGSDGKLYCGRCWFKFGEITEMVPCVPEICH